MVDFKPHVKVVQHPNPTHRSFHMNRDIVDSDEKFGFGTSAYGRHLTKEEKRRTIPPLAKSVLDRLQAIPGVTGGHVEMYEVAVEIGEAFDWKDIGPVAFGEIVNAIFPEVFGASIEVSVKVGWSGYGRPDPFDLDDDHGFRCGYNETIHRHVVEVRDPQIVDIEHLIGRPSRSSALKPPVSTPVEE